MNISLPELSLIVLVGPSGCGKSTFARSHFLPTEVVSSDFCRALVADDENDQSATNDAFDLLHTIVAKRLAAGRLTVVDATNVKPEDRRFLLNLSQEYHVLPVALVFQLPERICHERNAQRPDRNFGPHVIRNQIRTMRRSLNGLKKEGFHRIFTFSSEADVNATAISRTPLWNNRKEEHGPFDIIGDVHGCATELEQLLARLGYEWRETETGLYRRSYFHPRGRKAIFLGDLVDRGPRSLDTVFLVKNMVEAGQALAVPGNHDVKLIRKLRGKAVQVRHGLEQTLAEIEAVPDESRPQIITLMADFLDSLISHYVLDGGKLVVAHAGLKENMHGRASGRVRTFALYGETTGETDEFGLPIRYNWASEYRGRAAVVYGHTPIPTPEWLNNSINIDTGCVFGGALTALRYPERELVSVPAQQVYAEPVRPLLTAPSVTLTLQQKQDDLLDIADVRGKRIINTRLRPAITVQEANSTAALELMSRFAANPKWLIYLPPTMSPTETSDDPDWLEHPTQAFAHYRGQGVTQVVCEEKHMGSRAVVIVCQDAAAATRRFGVVNESNGIIYTRTGRRFFDDPALEQAVLDQVHTALTASDFWERFQTDWVCLDCELMPWSAKAQALLQQQYAAVGAAATHSLAALEQALVQAMARGVEVGELRGRVQTRTTAVKRYTQAYRHYCWPVTVVHDLKLAPFHILATEGQVHVDRTHLWHMAEIAQIVKASPAPSPLFLTRYQVVALGDEVSEANGVAWWQEMTGRGGEGMVVKPLDFIHRSEKGLSQPAVKVRGRDYLRIIYGPEYTLPDHLPLLRKRQVGGKRSLAVREFALGVEALERFVRYEPLRRVHECVFAILALESEPIDPRL